MAEFLKDQRYDSDLVQELDDGLERLGSVDSAFTLRGQSDEYERAVAIHEDRPATERQRDEAENQPLTRDFEEWKADPNRLDFPGVDTIPYKRQIERARAFYERVARQYAMVELSELQAFESDEIYGKYWSDGLIEIKESYPDLEFDGFRKGVTLAHETAHALDYQLSPTSRPVSVHQEFLESDTVRAEAEAVSRRLHGPFREPDNPLKQDYRKTTVELFADLVASQQIQPVATQRIAPTATDLLHSKIGELL